MAEETKKTKTSNDVKVATKSNKKTLRGIVVSSKMTDTIVVEVSRYVKHPKYKKYQKRVKKYHAHDVGNRCKVGEKVRIRESIPISKRKHFVVVQGD